MKVTTTTEPGGFPSQPTGIGRTTLIVPTWRATVRPESLTHSMGGDCPEPIAVANAFASSKVSLPVSSVTTCLLPSVLLRNLFTQAAELPRGTSRRAMDRTITERRVRRTTMGEDLPSAGGFRHPGEGYAGMQTERRPFLLRCEWLVVSG